MEKNEEFTLSELNSRIEKISCEKMILKDENKVLIDKLKKLERSLNEKYYPKNQVLTKYSEYEHTFTNLNSKIKSYEVQIDKLRSENFQMKMRQDILHEEVKNLEINIKSNLTKNYLSTTNTEGGTEYSSGGLNSILDEHNEDNSKSNTRKKDK